MAVVDYQIDKYFDSESYLLILHRNQKCFLLSPIYKCLKCILLKQPLRVVLEKRCSEIMQQIYRRTPMPKCDLNKAAKGVLL